MGTMKFQMFKMDLEKAEELEIKLPTFAGSSKKLESSRKKKIYFCFIDYAKAFDCVDHNKLWKVLQEVGIPDHLICLLRNLYEIRNQQLELDMEQQTGFKSGMEYVKAVLSPCLFNLYAEYIMRNAGLEEAQAGIKLPGEISITSDMQMTPSLWQKMKRN